MTRGQTFPAPAWWVREVHDATRAKGSQAKLIAAIRERFSVDYDAGEISRCASGERVTLDMAKHVSAVLGLPPPVFIARSKDEAKRMLAEQILSAEIDPQVAVVAAGVAKEPVSSHTVPVEPEHGTRAKPKRGRVGRAGA